MNPITKVILSRRSIRKWKDNPVSEEIIKELVSCGLSAPSAYDSHPIR